MSEQTQTKHPAVFPAIRYADAPKAIEWLSKTLGFEKHFVVPGEERDIAHAQLTIGNGMIMLGSKPSNPDPTNPWDKANHGIYVHVEDIDAHYAQAKAAGGEIVHELKDTEYGSREYSVLDPEGNLWSFGTYQPYESEHE